MTKEKTDFFWPSYTDLMTSLFFVMLLLFVSVYVNQHKQIEDLEQKLAIINAVEENLKPLKSDSELFSYEEKYKRFKLSFDVRFRTDKSGIRPGELHDYTATVNNINKAGIKLKSIIEQLKQAKQKNPRLKDISYILVIAGYASKTGDEYHNYELSYNRALSLRNHWKLNGINFEDPSYQDLIDLQISGNGWGGVGRLPDDMANQRFLIHIFPKIGDMIGIEKPN